MLSLMIFLKKNRFILQILIAKARISILLPPMCLTIKYSGGSILTNKLLIIYRISNGNFPYSAEPPQKSVEIWNYLL